MAKDSIITLYLFVQRRLLNCSNERKQINYKDARIHITKSRIPKVLFPILIKEMEQLELIKKIDRYTIEIINDEKCRNIDNKNIHRVYEKVGVF